MSNKREPLWTDERIVSELTEHVSAHGNGWNAALELLRKMRDEYDEWEPWEPLAEDTRKLARKGLLKLSEIERCSDKPTWRHHMDRIDAAIAEIDAMADVGGQQ